MKQVEHKCRRCGYETDRISNLKYHLARQRVCPPTHCGETQDTLLAQLNAKPEPVLTCCGCRKSLSSVSCLNRHQTNCLAYAQHQTIQELQNQVTQLQGQAQPLVVDDEQVQQPYIKKKIPAALKAAVWNTHIGESVGCTTCSVCKSYKITQLSFNCGHVVAAVNGGQTAVENLLPICSKCNFSMGPMNIHDFKRKYFPVVNI